MIALLSGEVAVRRTDHVIVSCGGVGYRLAVSAETLRHTPAVGKPATLHTHLIVRDDALALYGFASEAERDLFLMLIGVQSVGPKVALAVEDLYFGANARSAFAVGQARGVVILAAGQHGLPCCSYTPQQVKGAVCGSGRAGKGQVQRMVQALLSLDELPRPDHAADALAVAICHAHHHATGVRLAQALGGPGQGSRP